MQIKIWLWLTIVQHVYKLYLLNIYLKEKKCKYQKAHKNAEKLFIRRCNS